MHHFAFAVRSLLKSPGFTLVAVFTIAIGIAANTAIFSVFNSVVLQPLGFPQPENIVRIWTNDAGRNFQAPALAWPKYEIYRDSAQSFSAIAASAFHNATLTGTGEAEQLGGLAVSTSFLPTLGLGVARGRNFSADEDAPGGPPVVILSHELWQNRFGARESILGESIVLNGTPTTVIGVLAPQPPFPFNQAQYVVPRPDAPVGLTPEQVANGAIYLQVTARLKPGVSFAQADAEIKAIGARYRAEFPTRLDAHSEHELRRFIDELVGNLRPTFYLLLAACGFVLLIACANVASLFLGRLSARHKEIAVRLSLGATRGDIVRQFLIESLVFSLAAGAVGVVCSLWAIAAIGGALENQLPRAAELRFDGLALAFSAGLSGFAALLVGLVPALQASRSDLAETLKDTARSGGGGRAGRRFRAGLIVAEVALSVTLLIGAGLLLVSFWKLQRTPPGFDATGVAAAFVSIPPDRYRTPEQQAAFFDRVVARLQAHPQVTSASAVAGLPLSGFLSVSPYSIGGREILPLPQRPLAGFRIASPDYLRTLGLTLKEGRFFEVTDHAQAQKVVVLNESFARRLFPGESALGKVILSGRDADVTNLVVGIVGDVKSQSLSNPPPDEIYYALAQRGRPGMQLAAKTSGDPVALQSLMRAAVAAEDNTVALSFFQTMEQVMLNSLGVQRILATLIAAFAAIAFALAIIGLYSVLAYAVTQRTSEIGLRMALGAQREQVVSLVMREGLWLVGIGLLVGLVGAAGATRLMSSLLFSVRPLDPSVYAVVVIAFAAVAALACLVPSLRAARVDPIVALRTE